MPRVDRILHDENIPEVERMLKAGELDINQTIVDNKWEHPLLTYAYLHEQLDLAAFLIDNGADVNFQSTSRDYVTHGIKYHPLFLMINAYIHSDKKDKQLMIIERMLQKGADPNYHLTSINSRYHINPKDPSIYKALNTLDIKSEDIIPLLELLIRYGADVNARGPGLGLRPIELAITSNLVDVVRLLIANGADVHFISPLLSSPLNSAVQEDKIEIVKELLAAGVDVNHPSNDGFPPIFNARSISMLKLLIDHGADLSATVNIDGELRTVLFQHSNYRSFYVNEHQQRMLLAYLYLRGARDDRVIMPELTPDEKSEMVAIIGKNAWSRRKHAVMASAKVAGRNNRRGRRTRKQRF